jgi:hypothetical protein
MARIQIVALVVSAGLLALVLELVRRRRLTEEYSFLWIVCSAALLGLAARRSTLDDAAHWLGVFYPPIVLLMVLIVMVFVASLCFSVVVSRQRQQIERLIEDTAILSAEVRALRAAPRGLPQTADGGTTSGVGPHTDSGSRRGLQ